MADELPAPRDGYCCSKTSAISDQFRGSCHPGVRAPMGGICPDESGHALGPVLTLPAWMVSHSLELPKWVQMGLLPYALDTCPLELEVNKGV